MAGPKDGDTVDVAYTTCPMTATEKTQSPAAHDSAVVKKPVSPWTRLGMASMLLDLVSPAAISVGEAQHVRTIGSNDTAGSPWTMVGNGTDAPVLRVTACMANLGVDTFIADLHSNWDGLEPPVSWDLSAERYNQHHGRARSAGPRSDWQSFLPKYELPSNISSIVNFTVLPPGGVWTFTRALASSLQNPQSTDFTSVHSNQTADRGVILYRYENNAHEAHSSLFQDTLNQTQSPAVALQALLTRICQMVYYEKLPRLNESGHAETAFSHVTVLPTRWTGFGVGMGLH
ncbi:uncharacterized protein G6M90_00g026770 [Metarhizium brunneum]|uniref:Uncharacterized protein n=1 Tax=Metarhizium brunneum TaxID=500148 RepID=A0A7D5URR5_9HYPO